MLARCSSQIAPCCVRAADQAPAGRLRSAGIWRRGTVPVLRHRLPLVVGSRCTVSQLRDGRRETRALAILDAVSPPGRGRTGQQSICDRQSASDDPHKHRLHRASSRAAGVRTTSPSPWRQHPDPAAARSTFMRGQGCRSPYETRQTRGDVVPELGLIRRARAHESRKYRSHAEAFQGEFRAAPVKDQPAQTWLPHTGQMRDGNLAANRHDVDDAFGSTQPLHERQAARMVASGPRSAWLSRLRNRPGSCCRPASDDAHRSPTRQSRCAVGDDQSCWLPAGGCECRTHARRPLRQTPKARPQPGSAQPPSRDETTRRPFSGKRSGHRESKSARATDNDDRPVLKTNPASLPKAVPSQRHTARTDQRQSCSGAYRRSSMSSHSHHRMLVGTGLPTHREARHCDSTRLRAYALRDERAYWPLEQACRSCARMKS